LFAVFCFFVKAVDVIGYAQESRGLRYVYKRHVVHVGYVGQMGLNILIRQVKKFALPPALPQKVGQILLS